MVVVVQAARSGNSTYADLINEYDTGIDTDLAVAVGLAIVCFVQSIAFEQQRRRATKERREMV